MPVRSWTTSVLRWPSRETVHMAMVHWAQDAANPDQSIGSRILRLARAGRLGRRQRHQPDSDSRRDQGGGRASTPQSCRSQRT